MGAILADAMTWTQIGVIAAVTSTIAGLAVFLTKTKVEVSPQPLTVELAKQFADKHDVDRKFDENKKDHDAIFSKIGGVDRGNGEKISKEIHEVHSRINLLDKATGRLEATTEMQNVTLAQMDSKMTRILENMPKSPGK